jgi:regulator of protease activity HflC (stomatin/prohibitin superfamily)
MFIRWVKIREHQRGLLFRDGVFQRLLGPGRHLLVDPLLRLRVERVSVREPWLGHRDLEVMGAGGALEGHAEGIELDGPQRALGWIVGRLAAVGGPGLRAVWTAFHRVRVETVDAHRVRFEHPELAVALALPPGRGRELLEVAAVAAGSVGLLFHDGRYRETLEPGVHAFWRGEGSFQVIQVDLRERALDVSGQEILTADRVTLRLNAVVVFRVSDPVRAVTGVEDYAQALYRAAQLALREIVGTRELDALLADKDGVARQLEQTLRAGAAGLGVEVGSAGIRDLILPGEMREILNRMVEARKTAEAAVVTRREETAAMRSQANTARIFESNPMLMRLRELEVLEKVSERATLSVVLGAGGLADRVVKLL